MFGRISRIGLALAIAWQAGAAAAATSGLRYVSSPGDYIGGGQTDTLRAPRASVAVTGSAGQVSVSVRDAQNGWDVAVAAPSGTALVPGTYPAAARWPFQSPLAPGFSMTGNGRGCNQSSSWFQVHEYVIGAGGAVERLAIDFVQRCELTMPPLYGALRYKSEVPMTVPSLQAVAGADFAVLAGQTATLDGSQSFSRRGRIGYRWTQLDGPAVSLSDPASPKPSFTAPAVGAQDVTLRFGLDVGTRTGASSSDDVVVVVQSPTAARTELNFRGDAGDYITGGRSYRYDARNAVLGIAADASGGVSASVSGDTWWNLGIAMPDGRPLALGTYTGAQRLPFRAPGAPGLELSGDGRGCNTLSGEFTVHQLQVDASGNPQVLELTFEQHCEGLSPAARGQLLLNAAPHDALARQLREARRGVGARR